MSEESMEDRCKGGNYFDALIKSCTPCWKVCQQQHVVPKCVSYCDSARCTAKPGHYFDRLVKKCVRCAEICGKHPAECSQHCMTPPPVTTIRLLAGVTKQMVNTRTPPEPITVPLYSLLALCMALLLSSLCLALVVFLRGDPTRLSYPAYQEPSDDSIPIETCACVGCFPDLRVLGQDNDRPQRVPYSVYQQATLHRAHKGGLLWTDGSLHSSGADVQEEEAAMG